MPNRVLSQRQLNRATLARQLLLERSALPVADAVAQVAGLQAQVAGPPFIGLWTRLHGFESAALIKALNERQVVRATLMRSTIHLVTAEDYLAFRPGLQPALTRALNAFFGVRARRLEIMPLVEAARNALQPQPRTFSELRAVLLEIDPAGDPDALAYAVRTHLPTVQVPGNGKWGFPSNPAYALAEDFLGQPMDENNSLRRLLWSYLAAFGPASVQDFQAWSGLTRAKEAVEAFKPELRTFRDGAGRELLDIPDGLLPREDTPAPPRFMPEYDNLVLSHADRTRVIDDSYRPLVFLSAARVRSTFLLDGVVRGAWKIEKTKTAATLLIEPFTQLAQADRSALEAEGQRLLAFADAAAGDVRFADS